MACNNNSILLLLMKNLKDYNFTVYEDDEKIREILNDRQNKVIDLPYNREEDMCDLFETYTKIRLTQPTTDKDSYKIIGVPHYGNLMIFPQKGYAPGIVFCQRNPNIPQEMGVRREIEERRAIRVDWDDKIYVVAYDKEDYFMFEGYIEPNKCWSDSDFATLSPTKDI